MKVYCDLGHMEKIKNDASLTTKLRVVFDGSAKTRSGISLNDVQAIGPKVQEDSFDILVRFREYEIVITTDIVVP